MQVLSLEFYPNNNFSSGYFPENIGVATVSKLHYF